MRAVYRQQTGSKGKKKSNLAPERYWLANRGVERSIKNDDISKFLLGLENWPFYSGV